MATNETAVPVVGTGATGYVAAWVAGGLPEAGLTVHALVPARWPSWAIPSISCTSISLTLRACQ